jgi:hypothetical protein
MISIESSNRYPTIFMKEQMELAYPMREIIMRHVHQRKNIWAKLRLTPAMGPTYMTKGLKPKELMKKIWRSLLTPPT